MQHSSFNYLRAHRKRAALSEEELARLLGGVTASLVCRLEGGTREPTGKFMLGCEVVFGVAPRDMFPGRYGGVEESVMRRAARLSAALEGKVDAVSASKRRLLEDMIKRARDNHDGA